MNLKAVNSKSLSRVICQAAPLTLPAVGDGRCTSRRFGGFNLQLKG